MNEAGTWNVFLTSGHRWGLGTRSPDPRAWGISPGPAAQASWSKVGEWVTSLCLGSCRGAWLLERSHSALSGSPADTQSWNQGFWLWGAPPNHNVCVHSLRVTQKATAPKDSLLDAPVGGRGGKLARKHHMAFTTEGCIIQNTKEKGSEPRQKADSWL